MNFTLADIEREAMLLEIQVDFDIDWVELCKGEQYGCFPHNDEGLEAAHYWLNQQRIEMEISDLLRSLL